MANIFRQYLGELLRLKSNGLNAYDLAVSGDEANWAVTGATTANAAGTITKAAVEGQSHYITAIDVTLSGTAAGAESAINLKAGTVAWWTSYMGAGAARGSRVGFTLPQPLKFTENTDVNLVVGAAGSDAVLTMNMIGFTR